VGHAAHRQEDDGTSPVHSNSENPRYGQHLEMARVQQARIERSHKEP
jgi:hypothetical protein